MRVAEWTLIVMAVILHFYGCEWTLNPHPPKSCIVPFLLFVQTREQFAIGSGHAAAARRTAQ